jgi:hypothetical protein
MSWPNAIFREVAMRLGLTVLSLMLSAVSATAQGSSTELIEACRLYMVDERSLSNTSRASFNLGHCAGYLMGYLETHGNLIQDRSVCFPDGISVAQAVRVYIAWADKNPALWHLPRNSTVNIALKSAFPCRR